MKMNHPAFAAPEWSGRRKLSTISMTTQVRYRTQAKKMIIVHITSQKV